MTVGQWLMVLGVALEVAGVLVIAWEVHRDIEEAKKLRVRLIRASDSARLHEEALPITAVGGREPTLAERVERLERELKNQGKDIITLLDRLDRRSDEAKQYTTREVDELRSWVQETLDNILSAGWRMRVFGVGALLTGLLFTAAGIVVG